MIVFHGPGTNPALNLCAVILSGRALNFFPGVTSATIHSRLPGQSHVLLVMDPLRQVLETVGQSHLLKFVGELTSEQKDILLADLGSVDWKKLDAIYKEQVSTQLEGSKLKPTEKIDDKLLQELDDEHIGGTTRYSQEDLDRLRGNGLSFIGQGKVAALLLAGGQGTRLGVDYPKGMFDVGLPSHKSLFQLQAERILELEKLAAAGGHANDNVQSIIWYIMTSEATMARTQQYFREHDYFGLDPARVVFFEQGNIPCFDFDGKLLLDEKHKLSRSPDGNGGLYESLHRRGIIDHMKAHGVEFVHVYCVDNILVRDATRHSWASASKEMSTLGPKLSRRPCQLNR
ncbi:hypothetical protein TB1_010171 [Malus domestica]